MTHDGLDLSQYPLLRDFLRAEFGDKHRIRLVFHSGDEMIVPSPDIDQQTMDHALVHYFRGGLASLRAIEQVAQWRFGGLDRVQSILDFASGFGRLSRILVQKVPADRVAVAEINRDAVAFQTTNFGVAGFLSASDPSAFECEQNFDVVFAGSLFTHLPERTFRSWLARLTELLTSRGVLIFSLHNENSFRLNNPDSAPLARGRDFVFSESTWSRYLPPAEYGNTLVSDYFLHRTLQESVGAHSATRIPFGLGSFQDLCVVMREPNVSFRSLKLDCGAEGNLEGARFEQDGRLSVFGWAASRSADWPVESVRLILDGADLATVQPAVERPEVASYVGGHGGSPSGWIASVPVKRNLTKREVLQARARTGSGYEWLFFIGTIDQALLRPKLWAGFPHESNLEQRAAALMRLVAHLEEERAALRAEIDGMRASRFWRAREKWFRVKRALHLTKEES